MRFTQYDKAVPYATCATCGQRVRLIEKAGRNVRIPKYYRLAFHRDERGVEREYIALQHAPKCPSEKWVSGSVVDKIETFGAISE